MGFDFIDDDVDKVTKDFTSNVPNNMVNRMNKFMKLEKDMPMSKEVELDSARNKAENINTVDGIPIRPKGNNVRFDKETQEKFAKNGFRGTVSMKTLLTVGEGGKREHVTRKKKNNIFDMGGF